MVTPARFIVQSLKQPYKRHVSLDIMLGAILKFVRVSSREGNHTLGKQLFLLKTTIDALISYIPDEQFSRVQPVV